MDIYSRHTTADNVSVDEQRDKRNASFMFFLLFVDLLRMPKKNGGTQRELIEIWRKVCNGHVQEERIIEEFENSYQPNRAIWWYTRNSFLYSTLNKALRDHDINSMFTLRFFLVDLCEQITNLHKDSHRIHRSETIFPVYRGQSISQEELNLIRNGHGNLVTFNSFLSTSANRLVATMFTEATDTTNLSRILFEFLIDTCVSDARPLFITKSL